MGKRVAYVWVALAVGCAASDRGESSRGADAAPSAETIEGDSQEVSEELPAGTLDPDQAHVVGVEVSGTPGAYRFSVTVRSPDTGCERYADWWEVVSPEGQLIYRRILAHSHVDEQPFTRSGGPVPVTGEAQWIVRAHLAPGGYGGQVIRGSAKEGGKPASVPADFASEVASKPPLPSRCAF